MRIVDLSKTIHEDAGIMAFGFFDAIHVGHRKVIEDAVRLARENGAISSVFLFRNNIFPLFGVDKYPIFTFEERLSFIEKLGVDLVCFIDADPAFLSLTPEEFATFLKSKLRLAGFTCGVDFTFGAKGVGNVNDLIRYIGGVFSVSELLMLNGEKVSTERIKNALSLGDLKCVKRCLDRDFSLRRTVGFGRSDGTKIGYPTINCELMSVSFKEGVYFTEILVGDKRYKAVTNVGAHPTFRDERCNIESYLLDYSGNLYQNEVEIRFLTYHRGIVRFSSLEELTAQIAKDVDARRNYD